MSLVELLVSISIMGIIAATLGSLAMAVQMSADYNQSHGTAVQHGRVALERMERAMLQATASSEFPGFVVFNNPVGAWDFPDTLVVWAPQTKAADPDGRPRLGELLLFYPDPDNPHRLLESRLVGNTTVAAPLSDTATWTSDLSMIKRNKLTNRVQLTNLLRTANIANGLNNLAAQRSGVRFEIDYRPSDTEWTSLLAGSLDWEDMTWPQSLYGGDYGLRQAWCRIELQLITSSDDSQAEETVLPLFGSASLYYQVARP